ncbi:MAG: hypothetical protein IT376_20255 [Polyangiaceae bacterium]|nr:hypothetical protein [Polyangiaceae bacterium]
MMRLSASLILLAALGGPGCASGVASGPPAAATVPVETLDGQVVGADAVAPGDRLAASARVTVRAGDRSVRVELAPGWVLDERGLRLGEGDPVLLRGRRVGTTFQAWEVTKSGRTVRLRDEQGAPTWPATPPAGDAGR